MEYDADLVKLFNDVRKDMAEVGTVALARLWMDVDNLKTKHARRAQLSANYSDVAAMLDETVRFLRSRADQWGDSARKWKEAGARFSTRSLKKGV